MFDGRLFIAWTGADNRLNVKWSTDLGATWQNKRTLNETSPTEPALAVFNGKVILMWNGTDSANHLNFIESGDLGENGYTRSHWARPVDTIRLWHWGPMAFLTFAGRDRATTCSIS